MEKLYCDICEQPLDRHDPETLECVGPDQKSSIWMHKACRLRKLRVRIEWLASDYLELEKLANDLNQMPQETLVNLEKIYQAEVQFDPRNYKD